MPERSEYAKRYYKLNKFIILEKQMEYYHNNREKLGQRMRERYRKVCDDPVLRQKSLDYLKEWRAKNHTKSAIYSKSYYQRHKEEIKQRARERYHARMENLNIQRRERYNKKVTEKKKEKVNEINEVARGLKEDKHKNLITVIKKDVTLFF